MAILVRCFFGLDILTTIPYNVRYIRNSDMAKIKTSSEYSTTDTGLAAFLVTSGIQLIDLDTSNPNAEFTFKSNGQLNDLILQWDTGVSPVRRFYLAYKRFVKQIKESNG